MARWLPALILAMAVLASTWLSLANLATLAALREHAARVDALHAEVVLQHQAAVQERDQMRMFVRAYRQSWDAVQRERDACRQAHQPCSASCAGSWTP